MGRHKLIWLPGILRRVSRQSYNAVTRARGFDYMSPEEREAWAKDMDRLFGREPKPAKKEDRS